MHDAITHAFIDLALHYTHLIAVQDRSKHHVHANHT